MVGSGLSNIQRSKGQEGRYVVRGRLKKNIWPHFWRIWADWRSKILTQLPVSARSQSFLQRAMLFHYTREYNKIGAQSTFSSTEPLGFNQPKEAMGSENDGKANMCPCAVKETGVKTDLRLNFGTL